MQQKHYKNILKAYIKKICVLHSLLYCSTTVEFVFLHKK